MKHLTSWLLAGALCLALTGCGGGGTSGFDPEKDAQALLDAPGVFSSAMTGIDAGVACALYGIDAATVDRCAVYGATDSAEELAIFTFTSSSAAKAGAEQLGYRVEDRTDELRDYMPGELPKLEKAVIETRGSSVLLVIADDYTGVTRFLEN